MEAAHRNRLAGSRSQRCNKTKAKQSSYKERVETIRVSASLLLARFLWASNAAGREDRWTGAKGKEPKRWMNVGKMSGWVDRAVGGSGRLKKEERHTQHVEFELTKEVEQDKSGHAGIWSFKLNKNNRRRRKRRWWRRLQNIVLKRKVGVSWVICRNETLWVVPKDNAASCNLQSKLKVVGTARNLKQWTNCIHFRSVCLFCILTRSWWWWWWWTEHQSSRECHRNDSGNIWLWCVVTILLTIFKPGQVLGRTAQPNPSPD